MTAPVLSVTVPVSEPYSTWAPAQGLAKSMIARPNNSAAGRTRPACEFVSLGKHLLVQLNKFHLLILPPEFRSFAILSPCLCRSGAIAANFGFLRIVQNARCRARGLWLQAAFDWRLELYPTENANVKTKAIYFSGNLQIHCARET
jgi:hypothetical protein